MPALKLMSPFFGRVRRSQLIPYGTKMYIQVNSLKKIHHTGTAYAILDLYYVLLVMCDFAST